MIYSGNVQIISLSEISPAIAQMLSVTAPETSSVPSADPVGVNGSPSAPAVNAIVKVAGPVI
jgi:hypothetical protein